MDCGFCPPFLTLDAHYDGIFQWPVSKQNPLELLSIIFRLTSKYCELMMRGCWCTNKYQLITTNPSLSSHQLTLKIFIGIQKQTYTAPFLKLCCCFFINHRCHFFLTYQILVWVLLVWLSNIGLGRMTEESFKSLFEPGSGSGCSSFSTSSSCSFCSSQVDGWLLREGRGPLGSLCSSGSELSWELAGLRLPDESKRLLSGGL